MEYYKNEINSLRRLHSEEDIYLRSKKNALATAEIQQILKTTANKSGAKLISSQPIVGDQADKGQVGIQVRARANIFELRKLLYGLEAGSPVLFLNEITINRGSRATFRYNNTESSSQTLDIRIQVFGYIKTS